MPVCQQLERGAQASEQEGQVEKVWVTTLGPAPGACPWQGLIKQVGSADSFETRCVLWSVATGSSSAVTVSLQEVGALSLSFHLCEAERPPHPHPPGFWPGLEVTCHVRMPDTRTMLGNCWLLRRYYYL